jgi:glutathione synthase
LPIYLSLPEIDPFIGNLWKTYEKALQNGYNQKITLSILRCDYMLHKTGKNADQLAMKQVEINTIAAGFGWVGTRMSQLHKEILKWIGCKEILNKVDIF